MLEEEDFSTTFLHNRENDTMFFFRSEVVRNCLILVFFCTNGLLDLRSRDKKGTNQAWLLWPHFFWHIPYSYFVDRANNFLFTKCESWGEIFLKRDELIRKCMWKITAKTKYATFWRPSRKEKNKLLKVEKKRKKRMKESNRKKSGEIGKT